MQFSSFLAVALSYDQHLRSLDEHGPNFVNSERQTLEEIGADGIGSTIRHSPDGPGLVADETAWEPLAKHPGSLSFAWRHKTTKPMQLHGDTSTWSSTFRKMDFGRRADEVLPNGEIRSRRSVDADREGPTGPDGTQCPAAVKGLWPWPKGIATGPCTENQRSSGSEGKEVELRDGSKTPLPSLVRAFERYRKLLGRTSSGPEAVRELVVLVDNATASLGPLTDESYSLQIRGPTASLTAPTAYGAIHGLETFAQLVRASTQAAWVNLTDSPRFAHRGVLIDSARHFLPVPAVLAFIDEMSWDKLNVLHWHLTDGQGFTIRSPFAIKHGLVDPKNMSTYSAEELRSVVEYANDRAIRVVPELDSPAHVESWVKGAKKMVIDCGYKSVLSPVGVSGVLEMMDGLVGELSQIFPDPEFHIGMDEVDMGCLQRSEQVKAWIQEHEPSGTWQQQDKALRHAVAEYMGSVARIAKQHGKTPIVWQEAYDMYGPQEWYEFDSFDYHPAPELPKDAIVQVWKGWEGPAHVHDVAQAGFRTLKSSNWYLDQGEDHEWIDGYLAEPDRNIRNAEVQKHVEGGEACLWGEKITVDNLTTRAFPRLSAVAERLWSQRHVNDVHAAEPRLLAMSCELLERGVKITKLKDNVCV